MKDLDIDGYKAGGKAASSPVIAPDSARSLTTIKEVIGLSEGEIEGFSLSDVLLDNTPLSELSDQIKCDFRFGTPDQTHIDGFDDVSNEVQVNIELKSSLSWVRSIANTSLDAIGLKLSWAPLKTQKPNGDIVGATVDYSVELSTDGGTYVEVLKATVSDKTSDRYVRYHEIQLPKSDTGWVLRVNRLTPDSTSEFVSDKMFIQTYSELIKSKFTYPHTALIALDYDAQMFTNVAKVAVKAKGIKIKVPSNYNPITRTYSGLWNGVFKIAYTNNPAWIYYDLCTNKRYGLGSRLKEPMIDKWALYRISQYCDQMVDDGYGGLEPRFTCNVYIQSKERAFDILNRLGGIFRAITYWSGTQIVCDADIPQDSYYTFTNANVEDGLFEYSGASADDRYSVAKVAWDNPNNNFETEYEPISFEHLIKELGIKVLEIDAWGCTSRGQAIRAGRWALLSEYKTVTFKVGLDGYIPVPGKVIEIMDEAFAGKANGGRIKNVSADGIAITLDRAVTVIPGDRLIVNSNNGPAISRLIQSVAGSTVTVSQAFPVNLIEAQNVWVIDSNELATQKYRVLGIKSNDDNSFIIDAIEYTADKYAAIENGVVFEEPPISIVKPIAQNSVQNVQIEQHNTIYQGTTKVNLIIKWERSENATKYLVEWKKDDGSWISVPLTGNNSVEIENVYAGQYIARVTAISAFNLSSKPTYSLLTTINAKTSNPLPPANLTTHSKMFEIDLSWDFQPGSEDTLTTRIAVSNVDPAANVIVDEALITYDKAYPDKTLQLTSLSSGAPMWFKAKVIDRLGLSSAWTDWVVGSADDSPEKVLDLISGHISQSMLDQLLSGKINNIEASAAAANASAALANSAAANAQTAATNAQNTADSNAASISSEISNRIADVNAARTTMTNEVARLDNGITAEQSARQSGDAANTSALNAYKSSNDSALALVATKADTAVTTSSANSSQITSIGSRVTSLEGIVPNKLDASIITQYSTTAQMNTAIANSVTAYNASLQTGGTNFIKNGDFKQSFTNWNVWGGGSSSSSREIITSYGKQVVNLKGLDTTMFKGMSQTVVRFSPNTDYVLSFIAYATAANQIARVLIHQAGDGNNDPQINLATPTLTSTPTRYQLRFKSTSAAKTAFNLMISGADSSTYDIFIGEIQLEEGSVASAFKSSDLDTAASISANSSNIQSVTNRVSTAEGNISSQGSSISSLQNSLATTNANVATKADATTVSGIQNQVTQNGNNISAVSTDVTNIKNNISVSLERSNVNADTLTSNLTFYATTGEVSVVPDASASNGKVLHIGNNSGNDQAWLHGQMIALNPDRLYRLKVRYRRVSGTGSIYIGLAGMDKDKISYVNQFNGMSGGLDSSHYMVSDVAPALGTWVTGEWYIKGRTTGSSSLATNSIASPAKLAALVCYIAPIIVCNYANKAGETEIDYMILEPADEAAGVYANTQATTSLDSRVTANEGALTTQNNSIVSLGSRMSTAETGIANNTSANTALTTRMTAAEGNIATQSSQVTALNNSVGTTVNYVVKVGRNGGGARHIFDSKGVQTNSSSRGLNMYTFGANGVIDSNQAFDTYASLASACTALTSAIAAIADGKYVMIVGADNVGSFGTSTSAEAVAARAALLTIGANSIDLGLWTGNQLPVLIGRKGMSEGNAKPYLFTSAISNDSWSVPITLVNGVPTAWAQDSATSKAINGIDSRVTSAEGTLTAQSSQVLTLQNQLGLSAKTGSNLLIQSNQVTAYNGTSYPHCVYALGEDWEVGAQYTLLWCGEHVRGASDTNSYLAAYAGGGQQSVQSSPINGGKVINKVTFTKNSSGLDKVINFYMINRPSSASTGTIYWAVLVKGNTIMTDAWIPSAYDYMPSTSALSTAQTALTSRVTTAEGNISSLSSQYTTLNSTVASNQANLTTNYYTKSQVDSAISGQLSTYTSSTLNPALASLSSVALPDTRYDNQTPNWYWTNYPKKRITEFKQGSSVGSPNGVTGYGTVETIVPWNDNSGGSIVQIFKAGSEVNEAYRYSQGSGSTATWSAWGSELKNTKTTVTEHTASIDGIMGVKTVTIDNNGVLSGFGLISELKNGVVTSSFGINASTFYVGAPSNGKRPFAVLTAPGTINGVTVPAGTYIDTAYIPDATITNAKIANATIQSAKIADAAITSAKIADAAITSAKIADASIGSAKIGDATITGAKIANLTVDTVNVKDGAITQTVAATGSGSLTITTAGGKVQLLIGITGGGSFYGSGVGFVSLRVKRNGTVIKTWTIGMTASGTDDTNNTSSSVNLCQTFPVIVEALAAGTYTYAIEYQETQDGTSWYAAGAARTPPLAGWLNNDKVSGLTLSLSEIKK